MSPGSGEIAALSPRDLLRSPPAHTEEPRRITSGLVRFTQVAQARAAAAAAVAAAATVAAAAAVAPCWSRAGGRSSASLLTPGNHRALGDVPHQTVRPRRLASPFAFAHSLAVWSGRPARPDTRNVKTGLPPYPATRRSGGASHRGNQRDPFGIPVGAAGLETAPSVSYSPQQREDHSRPKNSLGGRGLPSCCVP